MKKVKYELLFSFFATTHDLESLKVVFPFLAKSEIYKDKRYNYRCSLWLSPKKAYKLKRYLVSIGERSIAIDDIRQVSDLES